jgi:prolyl-tRNA synthetase
MTHSDDDGLVIPPRLAPSHIVILPVIPKEENRAEVMEYCEALKSDLEKQKFYGDSLRVELDDRDLRGGEKMWGWIKKGIPVYVEVGPRDIQNKGVFVGTRDKTPKERQNYNRDDLVSQISDILTEIQNTLFLRAKKLRDEHTFEFSTEKEIYKFFEKEKSTNGHTKGGFVSTYWAGTVETEEKLKSHLKVTVRCIPLNQNNQEGTCPFTGEKTKVKAIIGKSY